MRVQVGEGAVPFVVTYRKLLKRGKGKQRRLFVGPRRLVENILLKTIEWIEEVAFETKIDWEEPPRSVAAHWAVQIEDPWDLHPGQEANLVARRMSGDMPPCGAHFEVVSPPPSEEEMTEPQEITEDEFLRAKALHERDHEHEHPRPVFRRPPDAAYAPRPVTPLRAADPVVDVLDDPNEDIVILDDDDLYGTDPSDD